MRLSRRPVRSAATALATSGVAHRPDARARPARRRRIAAPASRGARRIRRGRDRARAAPMSRASGGGSRRLHRGCRARRSASPRSMRRSRMPSRRPGGYVYVTRQLMGLMNDEAELAFVLGHETGHIAARHAQAREVGVEAQFDLRRARRGARQRRRRRVRQRRSAICSARRAAAHAELLARPGI